MEEHSAELAVESRLPATADVTRIILIYSGGTSSDEKTARSKAGAEDLAKNLIERARAGESFDELVAAYSDDPDKTASRGTKKDIPFADPPELASIQPLYDLIAQTKQGEYYGPIETYGFIQIGRVDRRLPPRVGLDVDDPGMRLRVEGREYKLSRRDGTKYLFANVGVPNVGKNNAKLVLSSETVIPFEVHRDMKTLDDWRKYGADADYQRLLRNPISMNGKAVKLRGRLIQYQELAPDVGWGGIDMWDAGARQQTGFVYFDLTGTTDVTIGRTVMLYGFAQGSQALPMQDGSTRQSPMIDAYFVEAL